MESKVQQNIHLRESREMNHNSIYVEGFSYTKLSKRILHIDLITVKHLGVVNGHKHLIFSLSSSSCEYSYPHSHQLQYISQFA